MWLDWLVFDDPGVAHIRAAVTEGAARVLIDRACREELERVLAYPLRRTPLDAATRAPLIAEVTRVACPFERPVSPPASGRAPLPSCRDRDDQKFLELARDCGAHALITKDLALLGLVRARRPLPFAILAPERFSIATA